MKRRALISGPAIINSSRTVRNGRSQAGLSAPSVDGIEFAPEMALFNPDAANTNANRSAWIEKLNQIFVS